MPVVYNQSVLKSKILVWSKLPPSILISSWLHSPLFLKTVLLFFLIQSFSIRKLRSTYTHTHVMLLINLFIFYFTLQMIVSDYSGSLAGQKPEPGSPPRRVFMIILSQTIWWWQNGPGDRDEDMRGFQFFSVKDCRGFWCLETRVQLCELLSVMSR